MRCCLIRSARDGMKTNLPVWFVLPCLVSASPTSSSIFRLLAQNKKTTPRPHSLRRHVTRLMDPSRAQYTQPHLYLTRASPQHHPKTQNHRLTPQPQERPATAAAAASTGATLNTVPGRASRYTTVLRKPRMSLKKSSLFSRHRVKPARARRRLLGAFAASVWIWM